MSRCHAPTRETTIEPVVATIVTKHDKHFTDLTIISGTHGKRRSYIVATDTHAFWIIGYKKWIDAGRLTPGTHLRTPDGRTATIAAVHHYQRVRKTHDLTLGHTHTYYVLAGATPVLVHNDGGEPVTDDFNQARNQALDWLSSRGFKAEKVTLGKFGTIKGKPVGMQTANGKARFRIEFDDRSGAHINVWAGKEKGPHFQFNATEATVTKLQGLHGCG